MSDFTHLSRRQRQILDIIFSKGEASVLEIQERLPSPPTPMAIRRMLQILEEKGLVARRKVGRSFVYRPCQERRSTGSRMFRHVLETFFDGSLEKALAAHLTEDEKDVKEEELRRVADLIKDARQEGR
ncbi:MAG: BlaI/MecI/CopY family transcriptional regulator [Verrucomicrobiota bacterium]